MKQIRAFELRRVKPNAFCCDCEKEVAESRDEEVWTIQGGNFRCDPCSKYEGLY